MATNENQTSNREVTFKDTIKGSADRWLARNRSLVLRQTPVWAQTLSGLLLFLGGIVTIAGFTFKIDEVVSVRGKLESVLGRTDVKSPVGGKISQVFVADGKLVQKGQLLATFDTTQASEDKKTLQQLIAIQREDLVKQLSILRQRKNILAQKLKTSTEIVQSLRKLVDQGGFQKVQFLQQQDQMYELQSQVSNINLDIQRAELESNKSIGQLLNQLAKANLQLQYQNITAPMSGVVFDSKAQTSGVLNPGEIILSIIPQDGLKAQVYVSNRDIGFVKVGQVAKVRVDAFPFTRYGELVGTVASIGADTLSPDSTNNTYRFPVQINLKDDSLQTSGVEIPLRSGMAISANLRLREKRLISLLSDMLVDQTESIKSIRQQ